MYVHRVDDVAAVAVCVDEDVDEDHVDVDLGDDIVGDVVVGMT